VLSFGQTLQNKSEVLLGTSWGNNLGTWGTLWEPDETHWGQGKEQKKSLDRPKKKLDLS